MKPENKLIIKRDELLMAMKKQKIGPYDGILDMCAYAIEIIVGKKLKEINLGKDIDLNETD